MRKVPRFQNIDNVENILELSTKTARRILERANLVRCILCGWDKASIDIHHIIPKKDGGSNNHDNLIIVCPNCHRMCHHKLYEITFLQSKSILNMLVDWQQYYNVRATK